jgi:hypothetical protein
MVRPSVARCVAWLPVLFLPFVASERMGAQPLPPPPSPPSAGGETVEVNIRIVPFCAVDAESKPIYDLRPEEVELRIGGKAVPIDVLDRPPAPPEGATGRGSRALSGPPRSVVFLLDSAFTSPSGLRNARLVAEKLLRDIPEGQRLSLWIHSASRGLEQRVAPVNGDARGRARFLDALGKVMPETGRLVTDGGEPLQLVRGRADRAGAQLNGAIDAIQAASRSEYEGIARELAGSLDFMAAELRHLRGPKLFLVFWQGLDPDLFFEGDIGFKPGSDESMVVGGQRFSGVVTRFTAPLQAIGDSGAMTVFVNASAPEGVGSDADGPIRHMARTAGAVYVGGTDVQGVEERIAAATGACYEAGFYIQASSTDAREAVEIAVQRPGARAWAPAALRLRETWATLTATEKKLLIVDLVAGGPKAQHGPVALSVEPLVGTVASRPQGNGGRRLRYQAAWPASLGGRELDVFNVVLAPPAKGEKTPRLLKLDWREKAEPAAVAPPEADLGKGQSLIWGIVAVEPGTGRAWYRRLQLAGTGAPGAR